MTVLMGNTPDAYVIGTDGRPAAGLIVAFYTDVQRLTRATGLTEEDGVTPSDDPSVQPPAAQRIPGSTITSKAGGVLSLGAPNGTARLYYDRGDGVSGVLLPRADLTYAPIVNGALTGNPTVNGSAILTVQGLANDPAVKAAVVQAAQSTSGLSVTRAAAWTRYPGDVWFAGDQYGNASELGFADDGSVAEQTAVSLFRKRGMPRVVADQNGGYGLRFRAGGKDLALGFNDYGQLDAIFRAALANLTHEYTGPDQPYCWPAMPDGSGGFIRWTKTDAQGNKVGKYRVRNV